MARFALFLALCGVMVIAPTVSAAPIRECYMTWDGARWYYGQDRNKVRGYSAGNFTTRVASCATARKVFRSTRRIRANSDREYWRKAKRLRAAGRTWRCAQVEDGHEFSDVRCSARGGRVVRWQEGS